MNVDWQMFAEKLKRHGMESKIAGSLARSLSISMSGGGCCEQRAQWALSKGFLPDRVSSYGLDDDNVDLYLSDIDYYMAHPINNHFRFWINDKLTLKYMLSAPQLRDLMPEYYVYIENNGRYTYLQDMPSNIARDGECLLALLKQKGILAVKPSNGFGGTGFMRMELAKDEGVVVNGVLVSCREFFDMCRKLNGCIVTEYTRQHEDLREIWDGAECALRIVMAKELPFEDVFDEPSYNCICSYARFGTAESGGVSNTCHGGIGVPFDFETGVLHGEGVKRKLDGGGHCRFAAHPDTGIVFEGRPLPSYQQVKDAVLKTCAYMSSLDYFGFDVIISERGPKLCEINSHPSMEDPQALCGPVLKNEFAREFFKQKKTKDYPRDLLWRLFLECGG